MNIKIYRTSKSRNEIFKEVKPFSDTSLDMVNFAIDSNKTYQKIFGFGGALTPASQEVLDMMDTKQKEEVLKLVFSKEGLNYSIVRLSINSCDFSSRSYDYLNGSKSLANFSLYEEERCVSYIKEIEKIHVGEITYLASPWSAPAYMKTNFEMCHGGKLQKKYYSDWANYFVLYIKGMQKLGVHIKYVTVQNEPEAVQTWESMIYTKEEEKDFLVNYLAPSFLTNNLDTKIFIWDHNKDHVFDRADEIFPTKNPCIEGIAYHWYCSEEFENLSKVHDKYPNEKIFFSEGCVELVNKCLHGVLFDFRNGETYGRNYILGLIHYTEAFIDWNILLDEKGGPNHVGNFCEAPIMYDTSKKEIICNTSYYFIKHFSHFLKSGDVRVELTHQSGLYAVAFKQDKSKFVVIIQNEKDDDKVGSILINGEVHKVDIPAHSIQTILLTPSK